MKVDIFYCKSMETNDKEWNNEDYKTHLNLVHPIGDGVEFTIDLFEKHYKYIKTLEFGFEPENEQAVDMVLNYIFGEMQGENWSPNGEARPLIESIDGVWHTSMSVGDIIRINDDYYIVASIGFKKIEFKEDRKIRHIEELKEIFKNYTAEEISWAIEMSVMKDDVISFLNY